MVGHVRAAAAALLPEQPDLLQARVLGADQVQHWQALPADVAQQELTHGGDAAQQRVHVRRDGAACMQQLPSACGQPAAAMLGPSLRLPLRILCGRLFWLVYCTEVQELGHLVVAMGAGPISECFCKLSSGLTDVVQLYSIPAVVEHAGSSAVGHTGG